MWLVGAVVLSSCGEGALEVSAAGARPFVSTTTGVAPPGEVAPESEPEACEASCRWGCEGGRCDPAVATTVGDAHSCAIRWRGAVDCWGANDRGQLGDATRAERSRPARVEGVEGAIAIDAGAAHTCALEGTGVTCWGANDRGQLGDGTTVDRTTPIGLALGAEIVEVAAGGARTCALTSEGEVLCWGEGVLTPQPIEEVAPALAIDVGGGHACAVREDGEVWCWGANDQGQLGDGTRTPRSGAVRAGALEEMIEVRAGDAHTCAIDALTHAVCWGDNAEGQLGDGTTEDRLAPGVTHPSVVAVGGDRTCGRVPFGEIACWGEGYGRDLALVPLLDEAGAMSIGTAHGCAVHRIGTARCWGANANGQLGIGTTESSEEPVDALPPPRS